MASRVVYGRILPSSDRAPICFREFWEKNLKETGSLWTEVIGAARLPAAEIFRGPTRRTSVKGAIRENSRTRSDRKSGSVITAKEFRINTQE